MGLDAAAIKHSCQHPGCTWIYPCQHLSFAEFHKTKQTQRSHRSESSFFKVTLPDICLLLAFFHVCRALETLSTPTHSQWVQQGSSCCVYTSAAPGFLRTDKVSRNYCLTRTFAFTHAPPPEKMRSTCRVQCMSESSLIYFKKHCIGSVHRFLNWCWDRNLSI